MKILDVSLELKLSWNWIDQFAQEINQLYRPCWSGCCFPDSYDIVYSRDTLTETKFHQILLKEWFYLPKKWGFLVIDYFPTKLLNPISLEDELWKQWRWKYDILEHRVLRETDCLRTGEGLSDYVSSVVASYDSVEDVGFDDFKNEELLASRWRIVLRKKVECMANGDEINKWTFWIITNGTRNDWIADLVGSIENLNVPHFEIIICGKYDQPVTDERFKYIPFNKRSREWWITKKKNLIIETASYQNIIIVHDRYIFDSGWFDGMKKWGNNFEFLSCAQKIQWTSETFWGRAQVFYWRSKTLSDFRKNSCYALAEVDDRDDHESIFLGGWILIMKKNIWILLNEVLFWNQAEDVALTSELRSNWTLPRFNPYSMIWTKVYSKNGNGSWSTRTNISYSPGDFNFSFSKDSLLTAIRQTLVVFFAQKWDNPCIWALRWAYRKSWLIKIIKI